MSEVTVLAVVELAGVGVQFNETSAVLPKSTPSLVFLYGSAASREEFFIFRPASEAQV